MTVLKSALVKGAMAAAAGAFLVGSVASADVVCNGRDCWHVRDHFDYPAGVGVVVHPDAWADAHRGGWHWRQDRFDRGYYRNGVWITF